jgi:signal transduction histidine kinase
MELTWANFGAALLWSAIAGVATWFVLLPVRRRSLPGLLAALVLTGAAASMGALLGATHAMLIPEINWPTIIALIALSGAVTAIAAAAVGRRLTRENDLLRRAVAEVGEGRVPAADGPPLTAEVARVREELRHTAAALAAARDREHALEAARRELVSWVSHDLRTPLAGLRAMAEALEDGVVDDPETYFKQMAASVDRLNQMVEDLFDLSRIQAGEVSHEDETIMLGDLVSDCVSALQPLAAANGVQLTGAIDESVSVVGNGPELNRAVTNLVANGIRHTPESGRVDVRVGVAPDSPTLARVVVRDECGGISPEHIERVFDVGFRGEAARTPHADTHPAGAGLGLAITRGIVEAHDGTITVNNTPSGCEFQVRLPTAVSKPPRQPPSPAS